ncbi:MAG: hydroxyisourate hydrolase, partial [Candidatus Competibacterales bacterium]|nr:hydroxyisourate hydrolase [Candidatus Competibacterales bacterium]
YELVFHAGAYFDRCGLDLPEPKFLDRVVIRFGLGQEAHYHVPLLLSPFGYSTYRGS